LNFVKYLFDVVFFLLIAYLSIAFILIVVFTFTKPKPDRCFLVKALLFIFDLFVSDLHRHSVQLVSEYFRYRKAIGKPLPLKEKIEYSYQKIYSEPAEDFMNHERKMHEMITDLMEKGSSFAEARAKAELTVGR